MGTEPLHETQGTADGSPRARHEATNRTLIEARDAPPAERRRLVDEVIVANLDVARSVARRYSNRGVPTEDLEQVACMALVRAANRFDPARAEDFRAYAVPTIRGELKRYFRDHGWTVRPVRRVQEVQGILHRAGVTRTDGRPDDPVEIADRLGLDVDEVREALGAAGCFHPKSLDERVAPDLTQTFADTLVDDDYREHEAAEARVMLRALIKDLQPRDRLIIYLRFFEGRTQSEIGEEIGVTQMQVSRLLTRILAEMKDRAQHAAQPGPAGLGAADGAA
jgi:RNA polymerase sigma-B factor